MSLRVLHANALDRVLGNADTDNDLVVTIGDEVCSCDPRLSARPGRHRRLNAELKEEYTATSERAAKASPDQLPEAGQSAAFGEGIERSLELAHQLAFVTAELVQDVAVEEQGC